MLTVVLSLVLAQSSVPAAQKASILSTIAGRAFAHPRRHRLIASKLRADDRFAYAAVRRADDLEREDDATELVRYFYQEGDYDQDTEFFLRKSNGRWRILYWMPVTTEGAENGAGYVFDYRPLRATGFPARLNPENLRRSWALKWIFRKGGPQTTIVTDVATLDRNRDNQNSFQLDGAKVWRIGLERP